MPDPFPSEVLVLTRLLQLNALVTGLAVGVAAGLGLFLATLWLVIKGGEPVGPHLALLGQFLIGYRVTVAGSVVGLLYGFVGGTLTGYLVSRLYNALAAQLERPNQESR